MRQFLDYVLSEDGYHVTTVTTGRHALRVLQDLACDVAVVDMSLPDMDGPHLIREIIAEYPHIKTIAASGAMENRMEHLAQSAGAVRVIRKPITPKDFRIAVYAALDPSYSWRAKSAD